MSIKLRGGTLALAIKLQEAMDSGDSLSANDIRTRLCDAINDQYRGTGKYAYCIDYFGDAESGDVIYSCDGETYRASYEMSGGAGAQKCIIDFDKADDVVPRTIYETEADEGEHIASMEAAKKEKLYGDNVPLYERFIAKGEREKATSGSFAGKGKSFPILKAGDVSAAASSIGRAGTGNYSTDVIKKNIIRIAKEKGWESELPKAWRGGTDAKESAAPTTSSITADIRLVESAGFCEEIPLMESARVNYPIKIISPGTGTTAYYPAKALMESADKFGPGTLMFWNHPTASEESSRPEGDLNNLAAITTKAAKWKENGPKGPGLYAEAKVMADYADRVAERAPHIGLSIRAGGKSTGRMVEGKPELASIDYVESVDYVTKAGRGGIALAEAARDAGLLPDNTQEASMDAEELKLLRESVARLSGKETRREAIQEGARILRDVSVPDAAKEYIIETCLKEALPMKDGALDIVKFAESINAEAKRFGAAIGASPRVTNMGAAPVLEVTEAQRAAIAEQTKAEEAQYRESWSQLIGADDVKLVDRAMKGRVN